MGSKLPEDTLTDRMETIQRTKHRNRRRSRRNRTLSYIRLIFGLVIVTAIVVGIVLAVHGSRDEEPETAEIAAPAEVTPEPAATPEPGPAPLQPPEVNLDSWELRLVRIDQPLPTDFEPELMSVDNDQLFDARAGMHLQKMLADARAAGFTTFICSGYRSYDTQYYLYWQHVDQYVAEGMTKEEAEAATQLAVNYPGASEHQLGLAADILEYQGQDMEPHIGGSGLMLWLEEHCADYGFIVRYPEDKTDITGIEYEPWHLRFVGPCARFIMENGLCLEEFLALYQ